MSVVGDRFALISNWWGKTWCRCQSRAFSSDFESSRFEETANSCGLKARMSMIRRTSGCCFCCCCCCTSSSRILSMWISCRVFCVALADGVVCSVCLQHSPAGSSIKWRPDATITFRRSCCCSNSSAEQHNQDVADTTNRFRTRCDRHNCNASVAILVRSSGVNDNNGRREQPLPFSLLCNDDGDIPMMQQEQQEQHELQQLRWLLFGTVVIVPTTTLLLLASMIIFTRLGFWVRYGIRMGWARWARCGRKRMTEWESEKLRLAESDGLRVVVGIELADFVWVNLIGRNLVKFN